MILVLSRAIYVHKFELLDDKLDDKNPVTRCPCRKLGQQHLADAVRPFTVNHR